MEEAPSPQGPVGEEAPSPQGPVGEEAPSPKAQLGRKHSALKALLGRKHPAPKLQLHAEPLSSISNIVWLIIIIIISQLIISKIHDAYKGLCCVRCGDAVLCEVWGCSHDAHLYLAFSLARARWRMLLMQPAAASWSTASAEPTKGNRS